MSVRAYIKELLDGKTIASSRIPGGLLEKYIAEGLLSLSVHGSRKSVRARDIEAFRQYLIDEDESNRVLMLEGADSRASLAAETGNSKLMAVRSCPGFPVNAYEPIKCTLNGNSIVLNPPVGSFAFICDWKSFSVPADVTVVGIENMENFRMVHRQKAFFEKEIGKRRFLFVSRYPQSSDLRAWLKTIPNKYYHFGDFDLAGIKIFQTEFERYLPGRSAFLIPSDIESRIEAGSSKRYDEQLQIAGTVSSDNPALQTLIDLIHKHRKAYDQEGYIE